MIQNVIFILEYSNALSSLYPNSIIIFLEPRQIYHLNLPHRPHSGV